MVKRIIHLLLILLPAICAAQETEDASVRSTPSLPDTGSYDSSIVIDSTTGNGTDPGRESGTLDTISYEADCIEYDMKTKTLCLTTNAVARYQNMTLYADTIVYFINDRLFNATGFPMLVEKNDTTVGEFLSYNIKTRRGSVRYATTHMDGDYFTGHRIVKSEENNLYIENGDYTTCAYIENPHTFFYAKNIKVIPRDKVIGRPVVMNIGDAPVALFPYYIAPLERGRKSGLLTPGWGGSPTRGGFVDNVGGYWAPNDYMDFKLAMKVYEFEDYQISGVGRYGIKYWLNGALSATYALGTNWERERQDWSINFNHNQNLTPDGSFTLKGDGRIVSGKSTDARTFYQKYSDDPNEIIKQDVSAHLTLSKSLRRMKASANITLRKDHNLVTDHIIEDIPSASFTLQDRPFFPHRPDENPRPDGEEDTPRWFNNIYYSYNARGVLRRDFFDIENEDSLPGFTRPAISQNLSIRAPQKLFKYITVTPFFNAGASTFYGYINPDTVGYSVSIDTVHSVVSNLAADTLYDEDDWTVIDTTFTLEWNTSTDNNDTAYTVVRRKNVPDSVPQYDTLDEFRSDYTWNTGISLSTILYGIFPIKIFNFAGLRHTLTPSVSYRFTPEHEQNYRYFPVGISAAGPSKQSQKIEFSLKNDFQGKTIQSSGDSTKSPEEKKFNILSVSMGTAYDFEKENRKWSDLSLSASTRIKFASISYSSTFWLYDEEDILSYPLMQGFRLSISPNNFTAGGSLWGGDLLVFESVAPDDPVEYRNAGPQKWQISLAPSYSYSRTRKSPSDLFVPTKNFNLGASASLKFTRSWALSWRGNYDFMKNKFVGHSINLSCDLECWDLRFDWMPSGINSGYYSFRVFLKKIPDIKWEERSR